MPRYACVQYTTSDSYNRFYLFAASFNDRKRVAIMCLAIIAKAAPEASRGERPFVCARHYHYPVLSTMILIDPTRQYEKGPRGWKLWCHMATDDLSEQGFQELHKMAARLGLPRRAFQDTHAIPTTTCLRIDAPSLWNWVRNRCRARNWSGGAQCTRARNN